MGKPTLILALNAGSSSLKAALFVLAEGKRGDGGGESVIRDTHGAEEEEEERLALLAVASVSEIGSKRGAKAKLASYPPPRSLLASSSSELENRAEILPCSFEPKTFSDPDAKSLADHQGALEEILRLLFDREKSTLGPCAELTGKAVTHTAHRVVHGGSLFTRPVEITADRMRELEALTALAPLHNTSAIRVIRLAHSLLSHAKHFAFFDTSFHTCLPVHVYTYPLPLDACRQRKIRKYGFHGLSYSYVTKRVERHLRQAEFRVDRQHDYRLVILHLGSGASACAVRGGRSMETSMGYTPVDGLMMASRPGMVDPTAVLHLFNDVRQATELVYETEQPGNENSEGCSIAKKVPRPPLTRLEDLLNHGCGFKGITGSSSIEEVVQAAKKARNRNGAGDEEALMSPEALAVAMFTHRLQLVIGGYAATLGGLDALVFTGGSGAKWADGREMVCRGLEFLSVRLDENKNRQDRVGHGRGVVWDVTVDRDPTAARILVVETDEEREMAEGLLDLLA